jgi:ribosomal protein S8
VLAQDLIVVFVGYLILECLLENMYLLDVLMVLVKVVDKYFLMKQLDKFVAMANQCITSDRKVLHVTATPFMGRILNFLQDAGYLYYKRYSLDNGNFECDINSLLYSSSNSKFVVSFICFNKQSIVKKFIRISKSSKSLYFNHYKLRQFYSKRKDNCFIVITTPFGLK